MPDFGVDFAGYTDIDPAFSTVTGYLGLGHAIARRLTQPTGGLIDRPDYGWDVRQLLNAPVRRAYSERRIADECLKEQRVRAASVSVEFDARTGVVVINIQLRSDEGPFSMTLNVSKVSIDIFFKPAQAA